MNLRMLLTLTLICLSLRAESPRPYNPTYTSSGQLMRPDNYREWIYLSSGLGMTYGLLESAVNGIVGQHFDNVFVSPEAYRSFLQTGSWPDKTMFVKEVRASSLKGSINKGGHFQDELVMIEVHIKDEARFPSKWEFFMFHGEQTAMPLGPKSTCHTCHAHNGAVDETFVQFYPTLFPVAKSKGTLKSQSGK